MILAKYTKQPLEVKDYDVDYTPWLEPMEDTLDDFDVEVECLTNPDDTSLEYLEITDYGERSGITTHKLKVWIGGGTHGERYKVTLRVTTVLGRVDESELIFRIRDY